MRSKFLLSLRYAICNKPNEFEECDKTHQTKTSNMKQQGHWLVGLLVHKANGRVLTYNIPLQCKLKVVNLLKICI